MDQVARNNETLAQKAKALAHPARIALVRALGGKPACCGHLVQSLAAQDLSLAQSTVSQHLRVLVDAGLVDAQPCGVETSFTLNHAALSLAVHSLGALVPDSLSADKANPHPERV